MNVIGNQLKNLENSKKCKPKAKALLNSVHNIPEAVFEWLQEQDVIDDTQKCLQFNQEIIQEFSLTFAQGNKKLMNVLKKSCHYI